MDYFIDQRNGHPKDDLVFYFLNWDNEGLEYDKLSEKEYDELPECVVCNEDEEPDYDWISNHYKCLCVGGYKEEDEWIIGQYRMEFLKQLQNNQEINV